MFEKLTTAKTIAEKKSIQFHFYSSYFVVVIVVAAAILFCLCLDSLFISERENEQENRQKTRNKINFENWLE